LVQVNGRSAKPVIDRLSERDQAWRASITHAFCAATAVPEIHDLAETIEPGRPQ
jgi:hypothetical protein